jgi:DNA-binding transcriptional ArsR family regulator
MFARGRVSGVGYAVIGRPFARNPAQARPVRESKWLLRMSRVNRDVVFDALADDHRRALLDRLRKRNGQTLAELCETQKITRQAVAKHLKVLEEANLVLSTRQGREKLHFLNPVPIHAVAMRWLKLFDAVPLDALVAGDNPERE